MWYIFLSKRLYARNIALKGRYYFSKKHTPTPNHSMLSRLECCIWKTTAYMGSGGWDESASRSLPTLFTTIQKIVSASETSSSKSKFRWKTAPTISFPKRECRFHSLRALTFHNLMIKVRHRPQAIPFGRLQSVVKLNFLPFIHCIIEFPDHNIIILIILVLFITRVFLIPGL